MFPLMIILHIKTERRKTVPYDDNLQHNQSKRCKANKPPTKVGKGLDPFRNCPTRQVLCFHRKYFVRALVAAGPRPSRTIVPPPQTNQSERRKTVPYDDNLQHNQSELCKADKQPTNIGKGLDPFRNCPTRQVLCSHRKCFARLLVAAGPRPSRTIVPPPQIFSWVLTAVWLMLIRTEGACSLRNTTNQPT